VRVAQWRVQKHVCQAAAANVQILVRHVCEDDATGVDAELRGLHADVGLAVGREAQQPQHAAGSKHNSCFL
jgi:hypothetical protein